MEALRAITTDATYEYEEVALRVTDEKHVAYLLPIAITSDRRWMADSRCKADALPTQTFYVDRQRTLEVLALRLYCRECPVRWECLDFALKNTDRYGVWGGYVDKERRRIRRMVESGVGLVDAANSVRDLDAIPTTKTRKLAREG